MELAFHRDLAREHANPIGLGKAARVQEEARDLWRFNILEDFARDVLYAMRSFVRAPTFAVIAILTLALEHLKTLSGELVERIEALPGVRGAGRARLYARRGRDVGAP
jgi:hypothetical protein